jgi:hypothetical protein
MLFPFAAQSADQTTPLLDDVPKIEGLEALQPDRRSFNIPDYEGIATLIIIFADSADDPDFLAQLDVLRGQADAFARRDVALLTDTDSDAQGPMRQSLRPRGFGILLVDSLGTLNQRRRTVTDARTLIRQIDEMP